MPDFHLKFAAMLKQPSAFVPVVMSTAALALALNYVFTSLADYGTVVRETDEGTMAHLWQLLMVLQLPVLAFFAIKWLPRAPKQALGVLALQAGAVLAAVAPVYFFRL
jgi:hypothetical protein